MNCLNCGHSNKAYLDFCSECHVSLDGSGYYEQGFGPKGELPPKPEPRDVPWVFLLAAIILWLLAALFVGLFLTGHANKGSNPAFIFFIAALGGMAFSKFLYEKKRPSNQ